MINPYCKDIKWTDRANDEMALITAVDEYNNCTLTLEGSITEHHLWHQPRNKKDKCETDGFLFKTLYVNHRELLNDIVEVFFPSLVFVPSRINERNTSEFFLFVTIQMIYKITWYREIEKSEYRGYSKASKKINEAELLLGYYGGEVINLQFPEHESETLLRLSNFLEKYRPNQSKKILQKIKDYFNIKSHKDTKQMKIHRGNQKVIKSFKEQGINSTSIPFKPIF